jgi:hypothetical protein
VNNILDFGFQILDLFPARRPTVTAAPQNPKSKITNPKYEESSHA